MLVYHGTSLENAQKILSVGFKSGDGVGMSSQPSETFIFVSPSLPVATYYVESNFRIKDPAIIMSEMNGKILDLNKNIPEYKALGIVSDLLNARPEGYTPEKGQYDESLIKRALMENGYIGFSFKDSLARGRLVYAVIPEALKPIKILGKRFSSLIPRLDKIADTLERNGLIKEAEDVDVVTNTMEAINNKIQQIHSNLSSKYPIVKGIVSGLKVRSKIPNMESISSTFDNAIPLDGIREVPLSEFDLTGKGYSVQENNRIRSLAEEIKHNKEINPLIVVADKEGLYILEGGRRADALYLLGVKTIPALVVIDVDDFNA